jgi:hypothetical protein
LCLYWKSQIEDGSSPEGKAGRFTYEEGKARRFTYDEARLNSPKFPALPPSLTMLLNASWRSHAKQTNDEQHASSQNYLAQNIPMRWRDEPGLRSSLLFNLGKAHQSRLQNEQVPSAEANGL